jgi:acylphosphatase
MIRRQFIVSGKVQGVWFRAGTREQALMLRLSGHVRNTSDGRVQIQAQGNNEELGRLEQWLQHGPPMAKVAAVEVFEIEPELSESNFHIL